MLVWSTQIPILPSNTSNDLMELAKNWLVGSPHSKWTTDDLEKSPSDEIIEVLQHGQSVCCAKFTTADGEFTGFRHCWTDSERRNWTTDICGWRTETKFRVGIQLFCESVDIGTDIPNPKKPYIVRQILSDLGGDVDGPFEVGATPIVLDEGDVDLAMRILSGTSGNLLPVIYVSSTWRNEPALDSRALAQWASGMAHVVVEPNRRFSFVLAGRVARTNPYEGAVALCWPNGSARQSRLSPYHYDTPAAFGTAITEAVRKAHAGRRAELRCTWAYIRELAFAIRIAKLRNEGSAGVEEYIKEFDDELQSTRGRLEDSEREVARLRDELARANAAYRGQGDGLLMLGDEIDLYSGEHRDALVFALDLAKNYVQPDGRVRHVLESILEANSPTGERERLMQAIRDAVGSCSNAGSRERRALEDIGFTIGEDGKHLKLVFRGDDRYTFAMPKSGSDHRGMKNWLSDVLKQLFK